jgi:hypothetical protein
LKIPLRRLENVTCRLVELSIRRITILPRPILQALADLALAGTHVRISMGGGGRERWEPGLLEGEGSRRGGGEISSLLAALQVGFPLVAFLPLFSKEIKEERFPSPQEG